MKNFFLLLYLIPLNICFCKSTCLTNDNSIEYSANYTLHEWSEKCFKTLPEFETANAWQKLNPMPKAIEANEYLSKLKAFRTRFKNDTNGFMAEDKWINKEAPTRDNKLFKEKAPSFCFPYVQKLIVPSGSKICFMGDIHGSIHSLLRNLLSLWNLGYIDNGFQINDTKNHPFYMIFTGDYIDRGGYGVEVLNTLMDLKLTNFDHVFLLRGNHEYKNIFSHYGFKKELKAKFFDINSIYFDMHCNIFELLPQAIYFSVDTKSGPKYFAQCCHGGIEPFYNPTNLLKASTNINFEHIFEQVPDWGKNTSFGTSLNQLIKELKTNNMRDWKSGLGFLWGDFFNDNYKNSSTLDFNLGRGTEATMQATQNYLNLLNEQLKNENILLCAFFRGHQHANFGLKIKGEEHWKDVVNKYDYENDIGFSVSKYGPTFTFSTATEGVSLPYDSFGILTVDEEYKNWRLKPYEKLKRPLN